MTQWRPARSPCSHRHEDPRRVGNRVCVIRSTSVHFLSLTCPLISAATYPPIVSSLQTFITGKLCIPQLRLLPSVRKVYTNLHFGVNHISPPDIVSKKLPDARPTVTSFWVWWWGSALAAGSASYSELPTLDPADSATVALLPNRAD